MSGARGKHMRGFSALSPTGIYVETDRGTLDVRLASDHALTPEIRLVLVDGEEDVLWLTPAAAAALGRVATGGAEPPSYGRIRGVRVGVSGETVEIVHHAEIAQGAHGWALVTARCWPVATALELTARAVAFLVARSRLLHGLDDDSDSRAADAAWAALASFYRDQFELLDHDAGMCAVVVGRRRLDPDGAWLPTRAADLPLLPWPAEGSEP